MGMLATVMNAIYLRDALNHSGFSAEVQTSIPMMPVASPFCSAAVKRSLEEGKIVIFAGGTGHPFFTTDTTAALRALEIDAEALLKATKVDGIYTDDPVVVKDATMFDTISYLEILKRDIEDEHHNTTRFLVMTADPAPSRPAAETPCVTSLVFRVRNVPAALYKALGGFATNGVNMTKLESYMEGGAFTATFFYADIEGRPEDQNVSFALEELAFFSEMIEILGVYPADPFRLRRL